MLAVIFIGVIAYYIASNLTSSFEKDEIETTTDNEVIKGSENDFNLNIHLEKHRANLEHERKLTKDKHEHEMAKINIILPICVIIVLIICCTCLAILFKDKVPNVKGGKKDAKMEVEHKCKKVAIPKSKIDDFNQLIKLGFEINDSVNAINSSDSFGSALDFLAMNNKDTNQKVINDGKNVKTSLENEIKTVKTDYIFI